MIRARGRLRIAAQAAIATLALVAAAGFVSTSCAVGARAPIDDEPSTQAPAPASLASADAAGEASDAGDDGPDGASAACSETSGGPYAARYMQALQSGAVKKCTGGCAPNECCYQLVACVER